LQAKTLPNPLAVNLVSGLLGSGKTSLIQTLLTLRPAAERWGVLVNEFGEIGIDGASYRHGDIQVEQVNGGCLCCTAQANLTRALHSLVQQPLDRLLIEPTGLGHPTQLIDTLKRFKGARPLALRHHFTLIDATRFSADLWQKSATQRDLVSLADSVILSKTDLISEQQCQQQCQLLRQLAPSLPLLETRPNLTLRLERLDEKRERAPFWLLSAQDHALPAKQLQSLNSQLPCVLQAWLQPTQPGSLSWQFEPRILFKRPAVKAWFEQPPPGLIRAKGIIRTGQQWQLINWVNGRLDWQDIAWREASRLEMLFDAPFNTKAIEKSWQECLQIRDL
jgi:G3E family GTPase